MTNIESQINDACKRFFSDSSNPTTRQELCNNLKLNEVKNNRNLQKKYIAMSIFCFAERSVNKSGFNLTHGFRNFIGEPIKAETHGPYTLARRDSSRTRDLKPGTIYISPEFASYAVIGPTGKHKEGALYLHDEYIFKEMSEYVDSCEPWRGCIYISNQGHYIVNDLEGNQYNGQIKHVDLSNLSQGLKNITDYRFKQSILDEISENGHLLRRIVFDDLDNKLNDQAYINEILQFTSLQNHTRNRNTGFLRISHLETFGHWFNTRKFCEISLSEDFSQIIIEKYNLSVGLAWPGHPAQVHNKTTVVYDNLTDPEVLRSIFNTIETESQYRHTLGYDLFQGTFWLANEYNYLFLLSYLLLIPVIPISILLAVGQLWVVEPINRSLNQSANDPVESFIEAVTQFQQPNSNSFFNSSKPLKNSGLADLDNYSENNLQMVNSK